jgi:hypothetical protein
MSQPTSPSSASVSQSPPTEDQREKQVTRPKNPEPIILPQTPGASIRLNPGRGGTAEASFQPSHKIRIFSTEDGLVRELSTITNVFGSINREGLRGGLGISHEHGEFNVATGETIERRGNFEVSFPPRISLSRTNAIVTGEGTSQQTERSSGFEASLTPQGPSIGYHNTQTIDGSPGSEPAAIGYSGRLGVIPGAEIAVPIGNENQREVISFVVNTPSVMPQNRTPLGNLFLGLGFFNGEDLNKSHTLEPTGKTIKGPTGKNIVVNQFQLEGYGNTKLVAGLGSVGLPAIAFRDKQPKRVLAYVDAYRKGAWEGVRNDIEAFWGKHANLLNEIEKVFPISSWPSVEKNQDLLKEKFPEYHEKLRKEKAIDESSGTEEIYNAIKSSDLTNAFATAVSLDPNSSEFDSLLRESVKHMVREGRPQSPEEALVKGTSNVILREEDFSYGTDNPNVNRLSKTESISPGNEDRLGFSVHPEVDVAFKKIVNPNGKEVLQYSVVSFVKVAERRFNPTTKIWETGKGMESTVISQASDFVPVPYSMSPDELSRLIRSGKFIRSSQTRPDLENMKLVAQRISNEIRIEIGEIDEAKPNLRGTNRGEIANAVQRAARSLNLSVTYNLYEYLKGSRENDSLRQGLSSRISLPYSGQPREELKANILALCSALQQPNYIEINLRSKKAVNDLILIADSLVAGLGRDRKDRVEFSKNIKEALLQYREALVLNEVTAEMRNEVTEIIVNNAFSLNKSFSSEVSDQSPTPSTK